MLVVPLMCSREMEIVPPLSFADTVATGSLNDNWLLLVIAPPVATSCS